jgi:hypothetical protein
MGLHWYVDSLGNSRPSLEIGKSPKPILLLLPGLGGGTNNLYTHSLAKVALQQGY